MTKRLVLALFVLAACDTKPAPAEKPATPRTITIVGVDPAKFDCQTFASNAEVSAAVGEPVTWQPADMPSPEGSPSPCVWAGAMPTVPDASPHSKIDAGPGPSQHVWQVHIDCRKRAEYDFTTLAESVAKQPDTTTPAIGKKAVDHANMRLVFLDDDTPCAVYVVGQGLATREALGRLVLGKLNEVSAPTHPHPQAQKP